MNKLIKTFTLSLIALSSFFFASCNLNSFLASESDNNSQPHYVTITGTIKNGDALPAEFTSDSSSNENSSAANLSKTAAPEIPSGLTYFAEATHDGLASPVIGTVSADNKSFTIKIEATSTPVTWKITCGAKKEGDVVLIDTFEKTISLSDVIFNHEFNVKPLTNSTGSVCLGVDYVADKIKQIEVSCLSSNKDAWDNLVESSYSGGFLKIKTKDEQTLPSGEYLIRLDFKKAGTLVYSLDQAVYVFDGFTTNKWFMTDSKRIATVEDSENKNNLKITQNDIAQFTDTTLYVSSTAASGSNLPPKGSYQNPYQTLYDAVDKCNSDDLHTGATYTIFVDGTTTEPDTIKIEKNTSIRALNSSAIIERDAEGQRGFDQCPTILEVSNTDLKVSISDITFDGKYTSETSFPLNGGCINNKGTLTLNNCTIKNCKARQGGGIYNNQGTLTLNGTLVTGCKADYSGGGIYSYGTTRGDNKLYIKNSSKIQNNEAISGGGVYTINTTAILDSTSCIGASTPVTSAAENVKGKYSNKATGSGGGLYIAGNASFTNSGKINYNLVYSDGDSNGGGIFVAETGSYTSQSSTSQVSYNYAKGCGGGIYSANSFIMSAGNICGNKAANGGGLYLKSSNTTTISGGIISSNYAEYQGGGIFSLNAVSLDDVLIGSTTQGASAVSSVCTDSSYSNYAGTCGGGIYAQHYLSSTANTKIWYNYAGLSGGGIYLYGTGASAKPTNINGTVYYNYASGTASGSDDLKGAGGGICVYRSTSDSTTTTISAKVSGNCSANYGGGIAHFYSNLLVTGTVGENTVLCSNSGNGLTTTSTASSTICSNKSKFGGGIYSKNTKQIEVQSGVKYNYASDEGGGIFSTVTGSIYKTTYLNENAEVSYNKSDSGNGNGVYCKGKSYLKFAKDAFIDSNNTSYIENLASTYGSSSEVIIDSNSRKNTVVTFTKPKDAQVSQSAANKNGYIFGEGTNASTICQKVNFVQSVDADGKYTDYYYLALDTSGGHEYARATKLSNMISDWDASKTVFVKTEDEIKLNKTNFVLDNFTISKTITPQDGFVLTTLPGKTFTITSTQAVQIMNATATKDKPLTINVGSANGGNLIFDLNDIKPESGSGFFDFAGTNKGSSSPLNQMINVNFSNVTIKNGQNKSGIYTNYGKVKLKNCSIDNINMTGWVYGGGICVENYSSKLWLSNTTISNCSARNTGGGIYSAGNVYIADSSGGTPTSITQCTAGSNGGGIYSIGGIYYNKRGFCSGNNLGASSTGQSYQLRATKCYYYQDLNLNFDTEALGTLTATDYDSSANSDKDPKNGQNESAPTANMQPAS